MSGNEIVFACYSKACAPPPAGTGGSTPGGRKSAPGVHVNEHRVIARGKGSHGEPIEYRKNEFSGRIEVTGHTSRKSAEANRSRLDRSFRQGYGFSASKVSKGSDGKYKFDYFKGSSAD